MIKNPPIWLVSVGYIVLLSCLIFTLGLFSTSYSASIALLASVVLTGLGLVLFGVISRYLAKSMWRWLFVTALTLLLLVYISLFSLQLAYLPLCAVSGYRAIVKPTDSSLVEFSVVEYIVFQPEFLEMVTFTPPRTWQAAQINEKAAYRIPERRVVSTTRGFLLREVDFNPLSWTSFEGVFPERLGTFDLCFRGSPIIELRDFPKGSFYAAKDAIDLKTFPYIDTETITWSAREPNITFAYIPPPYYFVRPLLSPFLGVATISQWIIAVIGVLGTVIVIPVVKPALSDLVNNKFRSWLDSVSKKVSGKKATLIVSSKGDEKEVDIKKK